MKNLTQWQHFKKNYLITSVVFTGMFILSITLSLIRFDNLWWFSFFFLILAWVIIPIGNYFSWKSKS